MGMKYVLNSGLELEEFDQEADENVDVLLIDNNLNRILIINRTCADIVNAFLNGDTIENVTNIMISRFEGDCSEIANDIQSIVNDLVEKGILCEV